METTTTKVQQHLFVGAAGIFLLLFGVGAFMVLDRRQGDRLNESEARAALAQVDIETPPTHPEVFDSLTLGARAVYVLDLESGKVLYEKNSSAQLPLASLTKLMTAVVARELLPKDSLVTITENALATYGESGFILGEQWPRDTLIDIVLISSSNDGAQALADAVHATYGRDFVSELNRKARELSMGESFFTNPTGLDVTGTQGGSYGSAHDMARLFAYIIRVHPDLLDATRHLFYGASNTTRPGPLLVRNTNHYAPSTPGIMGSKTGLTDLAGGNLAIAFDRGLAQPVVLVVLGSSEEGRFSDIRTLVAQVFAYFHTPLSPTL